MKATIVYEYDVLGIPSKTSCAVCGKDIILVGEDSVKIHIRSNPKCAVDLNKELQLGKEALYELEHLTPMGSEFYREPKACARFIKERFESNHKMIMKTVSDLHESRVLVNQYGSELIKNSLALETLQYQFKLLKELLASFERNPDEGDKLKT